ncbi:helix-turn-helix domain-containing protein [Gynurincola endophyticus]|uniref:helix-turn-helix domain-containing protein n=1 Tax=Gynurincola endophyticus TaxID=2479004 RepID=UPI000F8D4E1A|nr:helix-turn-helix domain-containing protein [Gynurincola endophyticus]
MNNRKTKSLYDLYQYLELPLDVLQASKGFTIHNLKHTGFKLPYQSPSFKPDYFSFLFVKDGSGKYAIDDYTFEVNPNTVYFTNPSNYRTFSWKKITEIYLITFDESFLKEYVHKDIFTLFPFLLTETVEPRVVSDEQYKELENIYLLIEEEYKMTNNDQHVIIGHLLSVLLYKIRNTFFLNYNPINEGKRSSQIVKKFKQLLEKNFRDLRSGKTDTLLRIHHYAADQNLHPTYLSNVVKTKTGKPISVWISEKTITESKNLLKNTLTPVKEIAFRLGFAETAHFSNYFKKHTHISPIQYRKQKLNNT